jgi:Na+:H+ antiporter
MAYDTLGAGGERLLDNHELNAVLVLTLTTSILGPMLTEHFASLADCATVSVGTASGA